MDVLSSREWAILIWATLVVGYFIRNAKRLGLVESFKNLLGTVFNRVIVSVVVLMSMYAGLVVYLLFEIGVWDWGQLKSTVIWYFAVALFSLFRLNHFENAPHRLRGFVADNFRLIAVIEYLIGTYTFDFAVEFVLVPVMFMLGAAVAVAETRSDLKKAHAFLNGLLSVLAAVVFGATVYLVASDFGRVANVKGLQDFVVPALMSALYAPFIAFILLYSTYQRVFNRLRSSIKKRHLEMYAKFVAFLVFNFRTSLLDRWATNVALREVNGVSDINQSVRQIFRMRKSERDPPKVDRSDGWSPYEAKDFLVSESINTRNYHPVDPENESEWFCCSDLLEFGEGVIPNNIAFYLNGNERAVQSMKLKLNINAPEYESEAKERLLSASDTLVRNALHLDLREFLEKAIRPGTEGTMEGPGFKVEFTKTIWPNHKFGGYDLGVVLSGI